MATLQGIPGVTTREIDRSLFVESLALTTIGFVSTARTGPVNDPQFLTSQEEYFNSFGPPDPSAPGTYAVLQALRQSQSVWMCRVTGPDAEKPEVDVPGGASPGVVRSQNVAPFTIAAATPAEATGTEAENFNISGGSNDALDITVVTNGAPEAGSPFTVTLTAGAARTAAQVAADINAATTGINASDDGTGKVIIEHTDARSTSTFTLNTVANSAYVTLGLDGIVDAAQAGVDGTDNLQIDITNTGVAEATQEITLTAGSRTAQQIVNEINAVIGSGGSDVGEAFVINDLTGAYVEVRSKDANATSDIQILSASTADAASALNFVNTVQTGSDSGGTSLTFRERYDGDESVSVVISEGTGYSLGTNEVFKVAIYRNGTLVRTYDGVRKEAGVGQEADLFEAVIGTEGDPVDSLVTVEDNGAVTSAPVIGTYALEPAGSDPQGYTLSAGSAEVIGTVVSGVSTGLQLFKDKQSFEIDVLAAPGFVDSEVSVELIAVAEDRQDCVAILDPPFGETPTGVEDWHNGEGDYNGSHSAFNSSYAATVWPWVQIYDALNNQRVWTPPSGHMINRIAFNDRVADPWYAAAGLRRGVLSGVLALEMKPSDGHRSLLQGNQNRVNTFVDFKRDGIVLYSNRTLFRQSSELSYLNVRRLLLLARKAIAQTVKALVFEPNDPTMWREFRAAVVPFLDGIKQRRGLTQFTVIMNGQTNTPDLTAQRKARAVIALQTTPTAEELLVDFVLTAQGVESTQLSDLVF